MARSTQITEAAGLTDPVNNPRCTVCHAPFAGVAAEQRLTALDRTEGISCESCHSPAEPWIRSHTRTDNDIFGYLDKVAAGLRDLKNAYVRANTCVACHENVDRGLLKAGHPELIFELDGQSVSEPRHWQEAVGWSGAKDWLVGQAVALREVSWQLTRPGQSDDRLLARQAGLLWIIRRSAGAAGQGDFDARLGQSAAEKSQAAADELAKAVAGSGWSPARTDALLRQLASTAADFRDSGVAQAVHARRGERLVLALDRLLAASDRSTEEKLGPRLKELFQLAQSLPDFNPDKFATALDQFAKEL